MDARATTTASVALSPWERYKCRLGRPMVIDRVLWLGASEADRHRLPAVRLRRLIDETSDEDLMVAGVPPAAIRAAAKLLLGPFEDTVNVLALGGAALGPLSALAAAAEERFHLLAALPRPQNQCDGAGCIIYRAAMWRVLFAHLLTADGGDGHGAILKRVPATLPSSEYPIAYLGTLFADTHLDLRAAAARADRIDDEFFLHGEGGDAREPVLTAVYPLPNRVLCAEELPDFAALTTLAELDYDTGWIKRLYNMQMLLAYLFLRKAANTICHVRSISDQLIKLGEKHATIRQLVVLVMQVILLGNMPHCTQRLPDASRVRIRLIFGELSEATAKGPMPKWFRDWMDKHRDLVRAHCPSPLLTACPPQVLLLWRDHLVGILHYDDGDPRFHAAAADGRPQTAAERLALRKWQGCARDRCPPPHVAHTRTVLPMR